MPVVTSRDGKRQDFRCDCQGNPTLASVTCAGNLLIRHAGLHILIPNVPSFTATCPSCRTIWCVSGDDLRMTRAVLDKTGDLCCTMQANAGIV